MTPLSLVPEIAAAAGIAFPQLVGWMVENAAWGRELARRSGQPEPRRQTSRRGTSPCG